MSMLTDIHQHLVLLGVTQNITEGRMPDVEPGADPTGVALFQYSGVEPDYVPEEPGPKYENPRLQVNCRAVDDVDAEELAYTIWGILSRIVNTSINGKMYIRIRPITSPFNLQRDEQDRSIWTCNYRVMKEV